MVLAADYPLLNAFWTMMIFFLWVLWFWLLITVFIDMFRRDDMSGWMKALWFVFVIVLPYIGHSGVPLGSRGLPVSQYIGAREWSPGRFIVVTERMIVYLSACWAKRGINSHTSSPGRFERIGRNSPR